MLKTKNLEDLLDKNKARELFLQYRRECGLNEDFVIQNIHRQLVLSPNTYAILYEINDGRQIRKIRVNASSEETRVRAFEVMKFLRPKFSGLTLFIPKVYFYDNDYNLVAYENIEGKPLVDDLANLYLASEIGLVGQWLNCLHGLKKPTNLTLSRHEVFFNFLALEKFYPALAARGPKFVEELNKKKQTFTPRLIHGDFQPTNMIISDGKITVFDFNDSQIDDPALDLAKFIAQLKVMLFRFDDARNFENLKNLFLNQYHFDYSLENFKIYLQMYYLQILCSLSASLEKEPEAQKTLPEIYKYWEAETGT